MSSHVNLDVLQQEVAAWAKRNFGETPAWMPMSGLCEEIAEFFDPASDKGDQVDALGDQCIFALNLCELTGVSFAEIYNSDDSAPCDHSERELLEALGLGHRGILKHAQGIRNMDDRSRLRHVAGAVTVWMRWAKWQAVSLGSHDLDLIASNVWATVSRRDWVAHPTDAHSHA